MFATTNDVKQITGKITDAALIQRAQYVIETYIGKFESEVSDLNDLEILKRATAYQTAYMLNNEDVVFEQMSVSTTGQNDAYISFRQNDMVSPFIAPMTVMVCNKLTFMRSRSIKTGRTLNYISPSDWRAY